MRKKIFAIILFVSALFALPFSLKAREVTSDLTLTEDIKDGIIVKEGSKVTLDLAGHNVTNEDGNHTIIIEKGATLTINGEGKVTNTFHQKAVLYNDGTLTVNNGTYFRVDSNTNTYYVIVNHGKMEINSGSYSITGGISSLIDNGWYDASLNTDKTMAEMVINGGSFEMVDNDKYIKNDDYGIMTINDGTFTMNKPSSAVVATVGEVSGKELLTINGGTFNYTGEKRAIWNYVGTTIINGGTYNLTDEKAIISNVEFNKTSSKYEVMVGDKKVEIIVKDSDIKESVDIEEISKEDISKENITLIEKALKEEYKVAGYFDINLYKTLNNEIKLEQVEENKNKVKVTLPVPKAVEALKEGYKRTYYIVRLHDDKTDVLDATINNDNTISFETDRFSIYTLTYVDTKIESTVKLEENPNTADNAGLYIVISLLALGMASLTIKSLVKHH